jgi:hypothetical protein
VEAGVQINGFKLTQNSGHIDKPIAILLTCSRLVCAIQFLGTRGLILPTSHGHQHQNEPRSTGPFFTARLAFVAPKAKTHNLKLKFSSLQLRTWHSRALWDTIHAQIQFPFWCPAGSFVFSLRSRPLSLFDRVRRGRNRWINEASVGRIFRTLTRANIARKHSLQQVTTHYDLTQ